MAFSGGFLVALTPIRPFIDTLMFWYISRDTYLRQVPFMSDL